MVAMNKKSYQTLNVLMNGFFVGRLKKTKQNTLTFTYTELWLNTPGARPISLALPLLEKPFTGHAVHHFFDGLLPDNPKLRARIQATFQLPSNHPFDLLKAIGKDCTGALQLMPGRIPVFHRTIRSEVLGEAGVAKRLRDSKNYPLGMARGFDAFRLTLPGSQQKTAFLFHNDTWSRPRDKTPTSHIIKYPDDKTRLAENEWLCMSIARAFGLPVAESYLLHFEEIQALIIKRFDRVYSKDKSWLMRLPQEDICQALGIAPRSKYVADGGPGVKDIMRFLLGSANPIHDRDVFYCSQVLFWLLAADDGHAKNFSVFIQPEGKYRLTPLYDITSSHQRSSNEINMAMPLYDKQKRSFTQTQIHTLERRHFLETAKAINYSVERAEAILDDMLRRVDSVIKHVSSNLPHHFPTGISEPIFNGMRLMTQKLKHPEHVLHHHT
jgi:serine/threonine-protein kinase HipA